MPLVSMRQLLDEAAKGGYGVGAFNVNDMEQIQAIMEAAKETRSPVIIQASRGARQFAQDRYLFHLILAARMRWNRYLSCANWRAPRLAWMMTGELVSFAAPMMA